MPRRPTEVLDIKGSVLERLLWDIAILTENPVRVGDVSALIQPSGRPVSTADKIRAKRRRLGMVV